jgi:hypothetical protein
MNEHMKEKILEQLLEMFQSMPEKEEKEPKEGEMSVMKIEGDIPEEMKEKMK